MVEIKRRRLIVKGVRFHGVDTHLLGNLLDSPEGMHQKHSAEPPTVLASIYSKSAK